MMAEELKDRRWFFRVDIRGPEGVLYLRRWSLRLPGGWRLMLHKIVREDLGRDLHDHPWWFVTWVLWGGYTEMFKCARCLDNRWVRHMRRRGWMSVGYRPAHFTHRIAWTHKLKPCWTLVLRGRRAREWGFRTECGWQESAAYLEKFERGLAICDDREVWR